jgi:hypothetical protein
MFFGANIPSLPKRRVSEFTALLTIYCEFLYFELVRFGVESHGPYIGCRDGSLLVREYHDLHPPFWEFPKSLPFSSAVVIAEIPSDLSIQFDFWGRMYCATLPSRSLRLFIDEREIVDEGELMLLNTALKDCLQHATVEEPGLGRNGLLWRSVLGRFWAVRDIRTNLGQVGFPPGDLFDSIVRTRDPSWLRRQFTAFVSLPSATDRAAAMARLIDPGAVDKELVP